MPEQPLCYSCKFRQTIPGDCHSRCTHPATDALAKDALRLIGLLAKGRDVLPAQIDGIKVVGNPHGIRMGWFAWPFNFDPTWLTSCDGYAPVEQEVSNARTE